MLVAVSYTHLDVYKRQALDDQVDSFDDDILVKKAQNNYPKDKKGIRRQMLKRLCCKKKLIANRRIF